MAQKDKEEQRDEGRDKAGPKKAGGRKAQEQIAHPDAPEARAENGEKEEESVAPARLTGMALGALGICYGDIGTSPLYSLRECFGGIGTLEPSKVNVLGILSLIFWALVLIISGKYMLFITRANNNGEGGMLALVALLNPWRKGAGRGARRLLSLGVFGTALLYGGFMLTPAITVSSAVEGLEVATHVFHPYVIPITIVILIGLFSVQSRGTGVVGSIFGPVMLLWFVSLGALGIYGIAQEPGVILAVNPVHAVDFFVRNRLTGFVVLGAVFLVMTGGEALYADMGHFGRKPIMLAWFCLVLPAVLLNYFGQGAMVLHTGGAAAVQPFYHLAPAWALYPLVVLSTVATVIASQAVISGGFSLTRQAVQLGQLPRMRLLQTSSREYGQIYVPTLNWLLMITTIALVLGFRTSGNLAWAYGVGVSCAMTITSVLAFFLMRERWEWSLWIAAPITVAMLCLDLPFLAANLVKVPHGGWFPILTALIVFVVTSTWRRGRELLRTRLVEGGEPMPLEDFLEQLKKDPPVRVSGTAVFLVSNLSGTPPMLLHHLKHNRVLHEQVLLLTVQVEERPRVPAAERIRTEELGQGIHRVHACYGYMQSPNVPVAVRLCEHFGIAIDPDATTFYVGRATIVPTDELPGMMLWREKLFAVMSRNATQPTSYYNVPPEKVVELGIRVEL